MSYQSLMLCRLTEIVEELRRPKRDTEITCVIENSNLYILQFSLDDESFHVYDFNGNDVTWTVTPTRCEIEERFDVVHAWDFCDEWIDLSRYDVIRLSDRSVIGSYFTDNTWTVVTTTNPLKGSCATHEVKVLNLWAVQVADSDTYTLPANVVSFAVSAQTGSFDISYDWWVTYTLLAREGVREYWNWKYPIDNSDQITILSHWDIDIIRETI